MSNYQTSNDLCIHLLSPALTQAPVCVSCRIVAKGASGGTGIQTQSLTTRGAVARGTFFLTESTELYILVGQEGRSACEDVVNQVS